jgi:hypothetical protein
MGQSPLSQLFKFLRYDSTVRPARGEWPAYSVALISKTHARNSHPGISDAPGLFFLGL